MIRFRRRVWRIDNNAAIIDNAVDELAQDAVKELEKELKKAMKKWKF